MPKASRPKLRIAAKVRPRHGHTFVKEWIDRSFDTGAIQDAFEETHLVEWPVSTFMEGETPAQERYRDNELEIIDRTLDALKTRVAEAFVEVATEVLNRERQRGVQK